jgi:hypothetical protein
MVYLFTVLPTATARGVPHVQDHDLIALRCVEDRVLEAADIFATHPRHLCFWCRKGILKQLTDRPVYAVGKIRSVCRRVLAQIRDALVEFRSGRVGIA